MMNNDPTANEKFRPTYADDRPRYRFEDYETDAPTGQSMTDRPPHYAPRPNFDPAFERATDEKHLDQLSLGFKIYAAVNALFSSFPIIHLILGIALVSGAMDGGKDAPPPFVGWFFIVFASVFILFGWAISVCNFYAGRFLKERRNHTFCFVMSCVNCAFMPLGTVLGIFGIIVLSRESVKEIFRRRED